MSSYTHAVTDANFETEVLNSELPVLVDFWATWCGPCKMVAPVLEEIAKEKVGQLKVAKIDVDENPEVAAKYGVRGIPTLLLIKNGNVVMTKVGALSKHQLDQALSENL